MHYQRAALLVRRYEKYKHCGRDRSGMFPSHGSPKRLNKLTDSIRGCRAAMSCGPDSYGNASDSPSPILMSPAFFLGLRYMYSPRLGPPNSIYAGFDAERNMGPHHVPAGFQPPHISNTNSLSRCHCETAAINSGKLRPTAKQWNDEWRGRATCVPPTRDGKSLDRLVGHLWRTSRRCRIAVLPRDVRYSVPVLHMVFLDRLDV